MPKRDKFSRKMAISRRIHLNFELRVQDPGDLGCVGLKTGVKVVKNGVFVNIIWTSIFGYPLSQDLASLSREKSVKKQLYTSY